LFVFLFASPGALVWGAIGYVSPSEQAWALDVLVVYGAVFVTVEMSGLPVRPPGLAWQVPRNWVRRRKPVSEAAIWGSILGPGLVTRNDLALMWALVLLLFAGGNSRAVWTGAAIGASHGIGRAVGIIRNQSCRVGQTPLSLLLEYDKWRRVDALALGFVTGACLPLAIWSL